MKHRSSKRKRHFSAETEKTLEDLPQKYTEISSPAVISAAKEDALDSLSTAEAILSIKQIETERERKEKNRIAAKKSREKKNKYMEEIEYKLFAEQRRNRDMLEHINTLYGLLEKVLIETEISLNGEPGMREIADLFINYSGLIVFPDEHKAIIENIKYFLFSGTE